MENRYYTPDISEFHVGFEYEYRSELISWTDQSPECYEHACDLEVDPIDQIRSEIKNGQIRVKYLDKEDIKSLGFKLESDHRAFASYICGDIIIETDKIPVIGFGLNRIRVSQKGVFYNNDTNDIEQLFKGTIKNRSELKRLLIQLHITSQG